MRLLRNFFILTFTLLLASEPLFGTIKIPPIRKSKVPENSGTLDDYLKRVRGLNPAAPATVGSLWVESGPLATFAADYKARIAGDTLVIHLTDNFTAATNGE